VVNGVKRVTRSEGSLLKRFTCNDEASGKPKKEEKRNEKSRIK
jgi:hypothetical protein